MMFRWIIGKIIRMCEVNMGGKNYIYDKTKFIWEKDLEKELNLLYRTIRKIANEVNISSIKDNNHLLYKLEDVEIIKSFLKKHKDTRSYFCSKNNGMHKKENVKKCMDSIKRNGKRDTLEYKQKVSNDWHKTMDDKIKKIRYDRTIKVCPNNYKPICDINILNFNKNSNKTSYIKMYCDIFSIPLLNISNTLFIKNDDFIYIEKIIQKYYKNHHVNLGEDIIQSYLKYHNINYEYQKMFNECRNPKSHKNLVFDFYLKDKNIMIELDGIYHTDKNRTKYEQVKYRDSLKDKFCKENNILMKRIKWNTLNIKTEILNVLDEFFNLKTDECFKNHPNII